MIEDTRALGEAAQADVLPAGARLGPYTLRERLGEGGMGIVYRAEQSHPIARSVALKLIKRGMDTAQVIRRFESEREALALMNHPGIARVLDAGRSDDGRPYFVMEHVAGLPLDAFCDQQRLDNRSRLRLLVQVCGAVHHAHQRGIIHRDLKPSNILVTQVDGRPAPKVIDFGLAKAMDARLAGDRTAFTRAGAVLGTPEYMSPEQAESGVDVDTTTDIYSLGVVLYQLLVGALPFEPLRPRRGVLSTLPQASRPLDPVRPSTRLLHLGDTAVEVAEKRATDVAALGRELAGDLDWIALKAMEHDRTRRYASASELAADIERYLAHQPIQARPPSLRYRVGKFVERHRAGVAAAAVVLLAVVAGVGAAGIGLVRARRAEALARVERARAEREAAQAQAVNDFLRDVLGSAEPWQLGREAKVVEALSRSVKRLESHELPAELEAAVRDTIGTTYQRLGDLESADREIGRSLEMRRRRLGPENPETLTSLADLAALRQAEGRYDEAIRLGREVLSLRRKVLGPDHPDTTTTLNDLAVALFQTGQLDEAEELMRQAWQVRRRVLGPADPKTLFAQSNLASLLESRQRAAEAEPLLREVLAQQEQLLGKAHSNTIFTRKSLGRVLQDQGKFDEAEAAYREALEDSRRTSGPEHIDTLITASDYALLLEDRGRLGEAEALLREALRGAEATLPKGHRFTAIFKRNLGECLGKLKRFSEGEALLLRAREEFGVAGGAGSSDVASVDRRLVKLYAAWGKPDRAQALKTAHPKP